MGQGTVIQCVGRMVLDRIVEDRWRAGAELVGAEARAQVAPRVENAPDKSDNCQAGHRREEGESDDCH